MTGLTVDYIDQAVEDLISTFGVKEPILFAPMLEALAAGKIQECLTMIAKYLGLPVVIDLLTLENGSRFPLKFSEKFESTALVASQDPGRPAQSITAQILIPSRLPIYGTTAFQGFHFLVKISLNCQKYPKTFVAVMAHELSHIILHSIMHEHKDNEFYTDLTAMILGFSDVILEGRQIIEKYVYSSSTTTKTTTFGYLSDEFFYFAYGKIKNSLFELKKEDSQLQHEILTSLADYEVLKMDYEKNYELLCRLLKNLDDNPKKIRKDDTVRIVSLHHPNFLQELINNGELHSRKLKNISESLTEILTDTSLFSKQRLNRFNALLLKLKDSVSEIKNHSESMESNIAILKRNLSLFTRYRLKN